MGDLQMRSGETALVTGGASGIGRALAERLAALGVNVAIADRQVEQAHVVAEGIVQRGGQATVHELDVRNFALWMRVANAVVEQTGRIDWFFNNAGIAVGGEMDGYTVADWDDVFDVNLRGVAYGIQAIYPIMIRQHRGHIVNTASVAGLIAGAAQGSYTATKHAVVGLSKALRLEAARHGVCVSVLCPGVIRTPILSGGAFGRIGPVPVPQETIDRLWERTRPMDPQAFARRALAAVRKNRFIIVIPGRWKLYWYVWRLSPGLFMRLSKPYVNAMRRELAPYAARVDRQMASEDQPQSPDA